ncbi:F-box/LRR-repeat MAX2 homolog A-like, partial [Camellia sinensis]|uniref:F-box/LRR-repeat MAX2 homolog A-like n=1 Tax=Camellia sinensis TaxID=4442 RepID=UPI001035BA6E
HRHDQLYDIADISSISNARSDPEDDESASLDARINHIILGHLFASLPLHEELVLDVCQNVRDIWPALELLSSKCPRLKSLKLGKFHGICRGIAPHPDGVALCKGLESLSIKNSMDLTDACLITISFGCPKLAKFEDQGCKKITEIGINKMAQILRQTLINVKISSCKHLNTQASLRALEPIQSQIQRLHLDCMWESNQALEEEASSSNQSAVFKNVQTNRRDVIWEETYSGKQCKYLDVYYTQIQGRGNEVSGRTWSQLQYLSLWIAVGKLLTPLALLGLENCPVLEEIEIIIEGDCRYQSRPYVKAFGLSSLARYPRLSKMHLDCGGAIGFALTAPSGHMDLSLWERFYLNGIQNFNLSELDYWPPQDRDVNQRSLSLPAAGLLAECSSLRKLFIHGTANEHFMMFLLRIPNIRDVQLREDYYPAPDNDTSTEMRVDSCCRFEDALNRHHIPD